MPLPPASAPFSDPDEIERASLEIIDREVPEPRPFSGVEWEVVRRMIHTTADFELLDLVRFHPMAVDAGLSALRRGCVVYTDTQMAKCGIPLRRMLRLRCEVRCLMDDPEVAREAARRHTTRAAEAMRRIGPAYGGNILVVGNAPTALLTLLEQMDQFPPPALVVGMPVGFVNAAESKALLEQQTLVPCITLQGRKGGSPLAASVVNALAEHALRADAP